jgi:REP element-mobilizing transposase RayT
MRTYKRVRLTGAQYFFTVPLAERRGNDQLIRHVSHLRAAFRQTRNGHPFTIDAIVILPEHLDPAARRRRLPYALASDKGAVFNVPDRR